MFHVEFGFGDVVCWAPPRPLTRVFEDRTEGIKDD
jgi:hypothetical protein